MRFRGKTVMITGGSSGIGFAVARRLAEEGARCILVARNQDRLNSAVEGLSGDGHVAIQADCTDGKSLLQAVQGVCDELGALYAGVFSAGIHEIRPLALADERHFSDMLEANVVTAAVCARVFSKVADTTGSSMLFVSSIAALKGGAAISAYTASKAALFGLAKSLALELASKRIRVNLISPGVVRTKMTERLFSNLTQKQIAEIESAHVLGLGEPNQVASAISFMVSEDASWITGANLNVDGGFDCH